MRYVGSKSRIAGELVPVIQGYVTEDVNGYIEPFVGGANVIDKIECKVRVGSDIHEELIELLRYVQVPSNKIPNRISEEVYDTVKNNRCDYDKWFVGLVGFCASWGSKYFQGYARGTTNSGMRDRELSAESIKALEKQRGSLVDIHFEVKDFSSYSPYEYSGYVFYCDPPYAKSTGYETKSFDRKLFYTWCILMSINNTVLISEYEMPSELFEVVWEKEHFISLNRSSRIPSVEKLFAVRSGVSADIKEKYKL